MLKHWARDILICLVTLSGTVFLYRRRRRKRGPLVRIVAFHNVKSQEWFRRVIKMLCEYYAIITPQQFHEQSFDPNRVNVLLTFDDGYDTWVTNVLPVLEERDLRGLFFVCSGLINGASDDAHVGAFMRERLLVEPKKAISWDGVRTLCARGHSIGGHTITHPNLTTLGTQACAHEILADKACIETELNMNIEDFAYPFGTDAHYNKDVTNEVRRAGYRFGYSALSGFVNQIDRVQYEIPRVCLEEKQSPRSIRAWINGGYDVFAVCKRLVNFKVI